jgi:hypothetical protein
METIHAVREDSLEDCSMTRNDPSSGVCTPDTQERQLRPGPERHERGGDEGVGLRAQLHQVREHHHGDEAQDREGREPVDDRLRNERLSSAIVSCLPGDTLRVPR